MFSVRKEKNTAKTGEVDKEQGAPPAQGDGPQPASLTCKARLELGYPDESKARAVAGSLGPDDDTIADTCVEGRVVVARFSCGTPRSLARALEDFMACLVASENSVKAAGRDDGTRANRGRP